jgi:HEPN domain-containing protein
VLLEDACYHTQQCAEEALKALVVLHQIDFPRTHVLEVLLDLLKQTDVAGHRPLLPNLGFV